MSESSNVSESAKQNADRHLILTRQALTPSPAFRARVRAGLAPPGPALEEPPQQGVVSLQARRAWRSLRARGKAGIGAVSLFAGGFLVGYLVPEGAGVPPPLPVPQYVTSSDVDPSSIELAPSASADLSSGLEASPAAPGVPAADAPVRPARPRASRAASAMVGPSEPPALSASAPAQQDSREELVLLRRAQRAVRAGNAALALALTAELEQRYPRSRLVEERRAIELMAYCQAGATDAAARALRFQREHPASVYAERIATLCPVFTPGREEGEL